MIDPKELPSLTLADRRLLPEVSGVYFALSDCHVLYIGQAMNIRKRWGGHHRLHLLQPGKNVRIAWLQAEPEELDNLERNCIVAFRPPLNGKNSRRQRGGNAMFDEHGHYNHIEDGLDLRSFTVTLPSEVYWALAAVAGEKGQSIHDYLAGIAAEIVLKQ